MRPSQFFNIVVSTFADRLESLRHSQVMCWQQWKPGFGKVRSNSCQSVALTWWEWWFGAVCGQE